MSEPPADLSSVIPDSKSALTGGIAENFLAPIRSLMKANTAFPPSSAFDFSSRGRNENGEAEMATIKVTPVDGIDAFYLDGVLSNEECACIRTLIDSPEHTHLTFWNAKGRGNESARSFRDADTIEIHSDQFGDDLWGRVGPFLSNRPRKFSECDEDYESDLIGLWNPVTTNHDLLFAKYPSGGHFAPHTDGRAVHTFNRRSLYSIILFLNDIPVEGGGGTRFYKTEALRGLTQQSSSSSSGGGRWTAEASLITGEVPAVAGRMLVFEQSLVHEGVACADPYSKYIIRSDVMYHRSPEICNEPKDILAYDLYREGEALAELGNVPESIHKMRKALKMSPTLRDLLNQ